MSNMWENESFTQYGNALQWTSVSSAELRGLSIKFNSWSLLIKDVLSYVINIQNPVNLTKQRQ